MKQVESHYAVLMEKAKTIFILQSAIEILRWDMETYMPPKGISLRSDELALLSGIYHQMITDSEIERLLGRIEEASDYQTFDDQQKRNVYLLRKSYDEQVNLPRKLVSDIAKQEAVATASWKRAKAAKTFSMFQPELEKLVNLKKEAAAILMDVKKTETLYDALIDIYEPKMESKTIANIFRDLKKGLVAIMEKCQTSPNQPDSSLLHRRVPIHYQKNITNALAKFIGYDLASENAGGRIDETEHPFTTGYYDDVRITTHYHKDHFTSSIFSVLHELGHAIYEQNLNSKWMYQPIGTACSLGFHESQSRFVENIIGRSHEFWEFFFPRLKTLTGGILSEVKLDDFVFSINNVQPSKIRVEADEVTYNLHIIIRFEIERDLMANKITVVELPQVWNQKYHQLLNVDIEHDSEGVLQDTHWASGSIGYFPTYTLGNIYSGHLLNKIQKEVPEWNDQIIQGTFQRVNQWLMKTVHQYGNLYDPSILIKKITGAELNSKPYLNYLRTKYSNLYGF